MKVLMPGPRPRIAFVGRSPLRLHVPSAPAWGDSRFFTLPEAGGAPPWSELLAWGPTATVLFEPWRLDPAALAVLPRPRIGVLGPAVDGPQVETGMRALQQAGALEWVTAPQALPPSVLGSLPFLQALPLPVDTATLGEGPRLAQRQVLLLAEEEAPPLASPEQRGPTGWQPLSRALGLEAQATALANAGVLVLPASAMGQETSTLGLLALAHGLLLVTDAAFPESWNLEPEDEYLLRPRRQFSEAVAAYLRTPAAYGPVRIRAWQKVRETFDASQAFARLLHDASLFGDIGTHLQRLG